MSDTTEPQDEPLEKQFIREGWTSDGEHETVINPGRMEKYPPVFEAELAEYLKTKQAEEPLDLPPGVDRLSDLSGADLTDADLSGADLTGANLQGADLTDSDLSGADLTGANLQGADLTDSDLSGANLQGANLQGANLQGADLTGADLTGADLSDAFVGRFFRRGGRVIRLGRLRRTIAAAAATIDRRFGRGPAESETVGDVVKEGVKAGINRVGNFFRRKSTDLPTEDLPSAPRYQTDPIGAYLVNAKLTGANLSRANLYFADLTGADLTDANLAGATMPDGSIHD
jgi:uncharacterized protein YjbI with pentapeptide repeats